MSEMYQDDVYGSIAIGHQLLIDLMKSRAIRRLQGVSQAGASSLVRNGRSVTRYEHSVGVMSLVGRLGGSEIEQAAGLLQDVSHTAFSHTVDYVFGDRQEEFHERIFAKVVENSDLPEILARFSLTWNDLFTPSNLIRVDAPSPLLCSDRIDYTLRDLVRFGHISADEAQQFVKSLEFVDEIIVVTDIDQAWKFTQWYGYLVGEIFMNPVELYAHDQLASIIRTGLACGVLLESDLMETDEVVSNKLLADTKHGLSEAFRALKDNHISVDSAEKGKVVHSKARVVDPPVMHNGKVAPLSSLKVEVEKLSSEIRRKAHDGVRVGDTM